MQVRTAAGTSAATLEAALAGPLQQSSFSIKSIHMDKKITEGASVGIVRIEPGDIQDENSCATDQLSASVGTVATAQVAAKAVNDAAPEVDGQLLTASTDQFQCASSRW